LALRRFPFIGFLGPWVKKEFPGDGVDGGNPCRVGGVSGGQVTSNAPFPMTIDRKNPIELRETERFF
jgi:hypothetical protein